MPTATHPHLAAAITDEAGHRANVTKWVAAGILRPEGGRPGTGAAYAWREVDVADARVARRLLDFGLQKATTAAALDKWRQLGRPDGYVGTYGVPSSPRPMCWTDAAGVAQYLATSTALVAVATW